MAVVKGYLDAERMHQLRSALYVPERWRATTEVVGDLPGPLRAKAQTAADFWSKITDRRVLSEESIVVMVDHTMAPAGGRGSQFVSDVARRSATMKYRLARIEIEVHGVRAVLEGDAHDTTARRYWQCDATDLRDILDWETHACVYYHHLLPRPFPRVFTNWAIEAGRLVAERLRASGFEVRIVKEVPFEIYDPGPPPLSVEGFVHELGHHLQHQIDGLHEAALRWRDRVTRGGRLEMGIGSDAGRRPWYYRQRTDGRPWIDPYMGRVYFHGEAEWLILDRLPPEDEDRMEVVSVVCEYLWKNPAKLARHDPELFDLAVTHLRGESP